MGAGVRHDDEATFPRATFHDLLHKGKGFLLFWFFSQLAHCFDDAMNAAKAKDFIRRRRQNFAYGGEK